MAMSSSLTEICPSITSARSKSIQRTFAQSAYTIGHARMQLSSALVRPLKFRNRPPPWRQRMNVQIRTPHRPLCRDGAGSREPSLAA